MARSNSIYVCQTPGCGRKSAKAEGRCPGCQQWDSFVLEVTREAPKEARGRAESSGSARQAQFISQVGLNQEERITIGISEMDRVLGGGLVVGSLVLIGGDPGIGKSTLALQVAKEIGARTGVAALYLAGEESATQVAMRARRTGCAGKDVMVLAETDLDDVMATIEAMRPSVAIVDSIQTIVDNNLPGGPGSPSQVKEAVARLAPCAKRSGVPIIFIGHVTKEGAIAGPMALAHMVDVELLLEGERNGEYRLLRSFKNRFGATDELGIFVMEGAGMMEAPNAGRAFVDEATIGIPGNVLTITGEGSRPIALEVQALVTPSNLGGNSRRSATGFDINRLHMILAVLEKRCGLSFTSSDVYLNIVGGMKLNEPSGDLAVALALVGSLEDKTIPAGMFAVGEVGLGGEVRRVRQLERRLGEAAALGLNLAIAPGVKTGRENGKGIRCRSVSTIQEAIGLLMKSD